MTTAGESKIRAGIYCRISLARDGDTTKTDDQERRCRELAGALGWPVADVYTDDGKSAWQPNRKRKEWDRMTGDIESGRINAIVVYHGDRLLRTHEDLLTLIRLARSRGTLLASPAGTRDLGSYDDQFILEIEASMAKRESANTSRRRKAQYERYRREGRVRPGGPGGRSFGFDSDNLTPRPAEFELIREAAGRILRGETPYSVCQDWTARGLTATTGKPWRTGNLGPMLALPRYAGLMPDGEGAAAWPAALERETWERLRLVLDSRAAAFPGHGNARRHLLSGIAVCGACGDPLLARQARRSIDRGIEASHVYGCVKPGCRRVHRLASHLDAYVGRMVVNRLNNPLNPEREAPAAPDLAAEWAALAREQAETQRIAADYGASAGRLSLLMARLDAIDDRMAELRERESDGARARLLAAYSGISWETWLDLSLEVRRALVPAHFKVTVLPASKRGPGFRTQDVQLEPVS